MKTSTTRRIAVLFGGRSVEHEVSIITAHQGMDALRVAGFSVLPIYISKMGEWFAGDPLYDLKRYSNLHQDFGGITGVYRVSLSADKSIRHLVHHPGGKRRLFGKLPELWADVFFPMIHGSFGEDGTLQGLLEMADVPYVGCDVLSAAISMDKGVTKQICRANDIPIIACVTFSKAQIETEAETVVNRSIAFAPLPLIVKPVHLGSSIGVLRCETREGLLEALRAAAMLDSSVLVERALSDFIEINCSVLGPPVVASVCEQPISREAVLSFDAKYRGGGKGAKSAKGTAGMATLGRLIPAPISDDLSEKVRAYAARLFEAIGAAGVARVDFLYEKGRQALYLNEVNTVPGSLAYYLWEATKVPFDELVTKLVNSALARHAEKSRTVFVFDANLLAEPPST